MNNSEVLEKLRAYLKCRRRQVKGIYEDCNNKKCDNCDLCYMQGTVGEHIEAIEVATQALEIGLHSTPLISISLSRADLLNYHIK